MHNATGTHEETARRILGNTTAQQQRYREENSKEGQKTEKILENTAALQQRKREEMKR
jgi:hypothetical protein